MKFFARFVGIRTRLDGLDIVPGKTYTVELVEFERGGVVNAFISSPGVTRRALCPYTSLDTFYANWAIVR